MAINLVVSHALIEKTCDDGETQCGNPLRAVIAKPGGNVMNSYHFTVGGARDFVHFYANVCANTPAEAVTILRNALRDKDEAFDLDYDSKEINYMDVTFDAELITVDNIDEVCPEDGPSRSFAPAQS